MGLYSSRNIILGFAAAVLLAAFAYPSMTGVAYADSSNLTVNAYSSGGSALHMYATIQSGGNTIKSGYMPLTIAGTTGTTYVVRVQDFGNEVFDHWGKWDGRDNPRTLVLYGDTTATAYFKSATSTPTSDPAPASTTSSPTSGTGQSLLPKTGMVVSLYMYPGSTGSPYWQQVIDAKNAHPSVPMVAVFNPSNGPGWSKDTTIANWVSKLKDAGVLVLGYTADDYGSKALSTLTGDADKYKNWYNADGLFIDEFTNKVGHESHYSDLTSYVRSIGMKMTFGNPGTDVPQSYIGTVDVINVSEGTGYMPISWLQYCVLCGDSGWHDNYDKRNFAYTRYGASWLDTTFESDSSNWVGLLYITSGTTSDGRWFHLPSYFGTEVATLDR